MSLASLRPISDEWTTDDLDMLPPSVRAEVHFGRLVIMAPVRLWHQDIELRSCNVLRAADHHAFTQVGVQRLKDDARVADLGVFANEPADPQRAWHPPSSLAVVVEVLSPSSEVKDQNPDWYAMVGIPEYWLAEPVSDDRWGALVTMHELVTTVRGTSTYVETRKVTLAELERDGL
jgi:Uma2 family endonuclease